MVLALTANEMLDLGLEYVGFDDAQCGRVQPKSNIGRFSSWYGSHPVVCVKIWHDLQTTHIPAARINPKSVAEAKKFLFAMYYLRHYPKENAIHPYFKMCDTGPQRGTILGWIGCSAIASS
jgi:hypothetical protein